MNRPRIRTIAAVAGLAVVLASCGSAPAQSPVRSLGPDEVAVPTFSIDHWACGGVGFVGSFVLHGDRSDPRVAWLIGPNGERRDLDWLPGSSARFDPNLEILDPSGRVIGHDGSIATGGCIAQWPTWFVDFETSAPQVTEPPMTVEP